MITFVVYKYDHIMKIPPGGHGFSIYDLKDAKDYAEHVLLKTVNTASVAVEVDGAEVAHYYNY